MQSQADHKPKPVVLCILDGWGHAEPGPYNAIDQATTPVYDRWWKTCPRAFLETSGSAVGLPEGQMGNSEVGHMNIGGGRVVKQDLPRIDEALLNGKLQKFPKIRKTINTLKETGGSLHIMGLLSPGGVHSHQNHMAAIAELFSKNGIPVRIHAFLDGRDVPPKSAAGFLETFEKPFGKDPKVSIATLSGRYFAMDRDRRWERVEKAYQAIVKARGEKAKSASEALKAAYDRQETDEFVKPTVIGDYSGMKDGDGFLMANFRADRARQILSALVDPEFKGFRRGPLVQFSCRLGMIDYSEDLNRFMDTLFPPAEVPMSLGEVVSRAGLKQLRIAETEKYAHVTFFFNGGQEQVFKGEERILIPSPRVATYDLKPEMSAPQVTKRLEREILAGGHDLIVVNFANPDMVGHSGKIAAAIKAVETIDGCLGRIEKALKKAHGVMVLSADHGNIEQMFDPETDGPHTAHTTTKVPVFYIDPAGIRPEVRGLREGRLADLAPTVLDLLELEQPRVMTGKSLLVEKPKA